MPEQHQTDHDLLIELNTKMGMLLDGQKMYIEAWGKLIERITAIEIEQGRHDTEINALQDDLDELRKKFSLADTINMVVTAVAASAAGAIGYFFGPH
jgi:glutathionylspermidine synthase